jgi:transposase
LRIIPKLGKGAMRRVMRLYRRTESPVVKVRALVIYRLAEGASSVEIERARICVRSTVSYVGARFRTLGELGLQDGRRGNGKPKANEQVLMALARLLEETPQEFGWARPTWTRELLVRQLETLTGVRLSLATVSDCLRRMGARWGRPKMFVLCPWKRRRRLRRIAQLRQLVDSLPADEVVLYEDEVDIHLNPKAGSDWMLRGKQRWIRTPGKNQKRYIAGAFNPCSGTITWVWGLSKASPLFIALIDELAKRYRRYRKIHLILDNCATHDSKATQAALARHPGKFVLNFLPPFCPDENKIEKLWLHLHANVTRNHRCATIDELAVEVERYLAAAQPYPGSRASLRRAA